MLQDLLIYPGQVVSGDYLAHQGAWWKVRESKRSYADNGDGTVTCTGWDILCDDPDDTNRIVKFIFQSEIDGRTGKLRVRPLGSPFERSAEET